MNHGDHGGGSDMPACKITMLWNWYTIDACFLSSQWQIKSNGAFAASCIGVILLVVLLEASRRLGKEFDTRINREFQARVATLTANAHSTANAGDGPQTFTLRASPLQQFIRALLHAITFGLAYIVMLLAMYYNGYILICIFIGAGLGKFLCDWMSATVVITETGKGCSGTKAVVAPVAAGIEEPSVCCG
ncbi:putative high affinity copper protein [Naviculisporaceae sp. PSN 640]